MNFRKYLTGDSGYAGVPLTEQHNTLVFDGKGQNKEGDGHDVFVGIPYERLNLTRLTDVRLSAKNVSIIADLTAAYEPETGVKKFVRQFEFTAPNDFVVKDAVETDRPEIVTAFFHADNVIEKLADNKFVFEPTATNLSLEIVAPKTFDAVIEKNVLTAPGKPGSVDKGEREERGVRLAVSTKEKVSKINLETRLKIGRK